MENTQIVNATQLEEYADTRESQAVIPELVYKLVDESCPDLTACRIPYGNNINQPGLDGFVETENGFRHFIPKGKSFWEIGVGKDSQAKATEDFTKRTGQISAQERQEASYVFVPLVVVGTNLLNVSGLKGERKMVGMILRFLMASNLLIGCKNFQLLGSGC